MSEDDLEDFEAVALDQIVDVHSDCVTVKLPNLNALVISDRELDYLFNHPEAMVGILEEPEKIEFFVSLIPNVLRIRNLKREMYESLGFSR